MSYIYIIYFITGIRNRITILTSLFAQIKSFQSAENWQFKKKESFIRLSTLMIVEKHI